MKERLELKITENIINLPFTMFVNAQIRFQHQLPKSGIIGDHIFRIAQQEK